MRILEPVTLPDGRISRGAFDGVTMLAHWTTVLLVLLLLLSGFSIGAVEGTSFLPPLLALHRSMGVAVGSITALRLLWRATFARFPQFPAGLPRVMELAAKTSEYALYALLLLQPSTGFLATLLRGRPFDLFGLTVPALLPRLLNVSEQVGELHEWGALVLAAVAGLHGLAALFHHFVLRDDVLEAMLPMARRPAAVPASK